MSIVDTNRDDRIRTCGPFVPNEVRYQTAPHPGEVTVEDGRTADSRRWGASRVMD